jgi:hypothetical protein
MAAWDVLHERVPGGDDPRRTVPLHAAHRTQPRLQPAVGSLDLVVRVPHDRVMRGRHQLVEDPRYTRRGRW